MIPLRRPSPAPHTGVLLLQLGGPDSLEAGRPLQIRPLGEQPRPSPLDYAACPDRSASSSLLSAFSSSLACGNPGRA